jgi:hypothetical protein
MESVPAVKPRHSPEATEKSKKPIVTSSFYIPRPAYRRLKEIAAKEDITLQDIYSEAIDAWLEKRGEAPLSSTEGD